MKQRLLVMNGQRVVQVDQDGTWTNQKVDKAEALKPGIYNLYMAKEADKSQCYNGVIVHADKKNIYQQIAKSFIIHSRSDFDVMPVVGAAKSISYDAKGRASVAQAVKLSRGRSR